MDLTKLPLGDGKLSAAPHGGPDLGLPRRSQWRRGAVDGPWIDKANGTYRFHQKSRGQRQGGVDAAFHNVLQGDNRVFTSNDLPNHPTGTFPIPVHRRGL